MKLLAKESVMSFFFSFLILQGYKNPDRLYPFKFGIYLKKYFPILACGTVAARFKFPLISIFISNALFT